MKQFGEKMTREILKKTRKEFGKFAWENKWSVVFQVCQKYGDSLDKKLTEKIYDELKEEKK